MLSRRLDLRSAFERAWSNSQAGDHSSGGPVSSIAAAARQIEWTWKRPLVFTTSEGLDVEPLKTGEQEWAHLVRESARLAAWRAAACHRHDMSGIEHGIDKDATLALLSGSRLSPLQKGKLRAILAGAIWTQ
ncbi:unnamed protein product, partial [Polarella glacialis]